MRTEPQIQRRANMLLHKAGIRTAPIDLDAIIRLVGAEVRLEKADQEVSGGLYRLPQSTIIGVNAEHPPVRRRFTIAHELGHLVLHDLPVFVDRTFPANGPFAGTPLFKRSHVSSTATDPIEIEANRFAACLLMPRSFLEKDLAEVAFPVRADDVDRLATLYEVSAQAMTFRLTNLGVPLDAA